MVSSELHDKEFVEGHIDRDSLLIQYSYRPRGKRSTAPCLGFSYFPLCCEVGFGYPRYLLTFSKNVARISEWKTNHLEQVVLISFLLWPNIKTARILLPTGFQTVSCPQVLANTKIETAQLPALSIHAPSPLPFHSCIPCLSSEQERFVWLEDTLGPQTWGAYSSALIFSNKASSSSSPDQFFIWRSSQGFEFRILWTR